MLLVIREFSNQVPTTLEKPDETGNQLKLLQLIRLVIGDIIKLDGDSSLNRGKQGLEVLRPGLDRFNIDFPLQFAR